MASLLPMGIFVNTAEVYEEIAGYSVVPPDKLREYWKVYTTTARRLRDPKARRLENFWWHVWGSNKRSLSGPQLARLFEDFSNSPPIVPLRYPTNRYEGPPIPRRQPTAKPPQPPTTEGEASRQGSDGASNKLSVPSTSTAGPSQATPKTPRRPSASGTRTEAQVVSPLDGKTKDGETLPRSTVAGPSETSDIRYTVLPSAVAEAEAEAKRPTKSLAQPLTRGSTLGQQKDMAEALGITTQVKLVKRMQGVRSPEENFIQKMHPINSPPLLVPPTGAAPKPASRAPQPPALAPQPPGLASPMPAAIQEHLRKQREPPGAARRKAWKPTLQASSTQPHGKQRLVKVPQGAEYTEQAGVPKGWIEISSKQTLPKPKEEKARRRQGSGTQSKTSESSGPRQRGPDKEKGQATASPEPEEESGYIIPKLTERSQLVTRRRVLPLPVSRRPRFVMPPRRPARQNSIMSDTSQTSMGSWSGRMTPTKPAVRPPGVGSPENITAHGLKDVSSLPAPTTRVSLQTPGAQLWVPPTKPVSRSVGGVGQSPGYRPWVPPPNPLPKEEVLPTSSLNEFFIVPSPVPPPSPGRTNLLPPPSVGPMPIRPGMPTARSSPTLRSRSNMHPGTPSSLFPPSMLQASASTTEVAAMTVRGEIASENAPQVPPLYSPHSGHPALQRPSGSVLNRSQQLPARPIPFARTRSQLKVLLEENSGEGGSSKVKGKMPRRRPSCE